MKNKIKAFLEEHDLQYACSMLLVFPALIWTLAAFVLTFTYSYVALYMIPGVLLHYGWLLGCKKKEKKKHRWTAFWLASIAVYSTYAIAFGYPYGFEGGFVFQPIFHIWCVYVLFFSTVALIKTTQNQSVVTTPDAARPTS